MERLDDGEAFADVAADYDEQFATSGGSVTGEPTQPCIDPTGLTEAAAPIVDTPSTRPAPASRSARSRPRWPPLIAVIPPFDDVRSQFADAALARRYRRCWPTPRSASIPATAGGTARPAPSWRSTSRRAGSAPVDSAVEASRRDRIVNGHVTIVGLGPGGADHVTVETLGAIARIPIRFLRTSRQPSAHLVPDAVAFDEHYEAAERFEDVYAAIVERLVVAAAEHGEILYTVPGSPLVLERTVRLLVADERVATDVLPALSFLDVAWARLGIDPIEEGVRLVDGHEFAAAAISGAGPLLIAHTHANWVLSDVKLAVDEASGDEPVTILQGLGTDAERVVATTWSELDRTIEADHLTSVYVPRLPTPIGDHYVRFHELTRTLRERCPWDQEQTHQTLAPYLVEEASNWSRPRWPPRSSDDPTSDVDVIEELGDLLYHIEFHARDRRARRTILDRRRHVERARQARAPPPARVRGGRCRRRQSGGGQLGGDQAGREAAHVAVRRGAHVAAGARLRPEARAQGGQGRVRLARRRPRDDRRRRRVGRAASEARRVGRRGGDRRRVRRRVVPFVNVARHLGVDAELALRASAGKFRRRFETIEGLVADAASTSTPPTSPPSTPCGTKSKPTREPR